MVFMPPKLCTYVLQSMFASVAHLHDLPQLWCQFHAPLYGAYEANQDDSHPGSANYCLNPVYNRDTLAVKLVFGESGRLV